MISIFIKYLILIAGSNFWVEDDSQRNAVLFFFFLLIPRMGVLCAGAKMILLLMYNFLGPLFGQMMKQRHKVEREQNIGEEIGRSKNKEVAKVNPKLAAMNKKFGMIHGLSSLANIMSFGSLAMHSWYLAGKMDL